MSLAQFSAHFSLNGDVELEIFVTLHEEPIHMLALWFLHVQGDLRALALDSIETSPLLETQYSFFMHLCPKSLPPHHSHALNCKFLHAKKDQSSSSWINNNKKLYMLGWGCFDAYALECPSIWVSHGPHCSKILGFSLSCPQKEPTFRGYTTSLRWAHLGTLLTTPNVW